MASEVEEWRVAQVDDCRLASCALHLNLKCVVTGHFEGHLAHHCPRKPFMEPLRYVAHYHLKARYVGSPVYL